MKNTFSLDIKAISDKFLAENIKYAELYKKSSSLDRCFLKKKLNYKNNNSNYLESNNNNYNSINSNIKEFTNNIINIESHNQINNNINTSSIARSNDKYNKKLSVIDEVIRHERIDSIFSQDSYLSKIHNSLEDSNNEKSTNLSTTISQSESSSILQCSMIVLSKKSSLSKLEESSFFNEKLTYNYNNNLYKTRNIRLSKNEHNQNNIKTINYNNSCSNLNLIYNKLNKRKAYNNNNNNISCLNNCNYNSNNSYKKLGKRNEINYKDYSYTNNNIEGFNKEKINLYMSVSKLNYVKNNLIPFKRTNTNNINEEKDRRLNININSKNCCIYPKNTFKHQNSSSSNSIINSLNKNKIPLRANKQTSFYGKLTISNNNNYNNNYNYNEGNHNNHTDYILSKNNTLTTDSNIISINNVVDINNNNKNLNNLNNVNKRIGDILKKNLK